MSEEEKKPENKYGIFNVPRNLLWDGLLFNSGSGLLPENNRYRLPHDNAVPKQEQDESPETIHEISIKKETVIKFDDMIGPAPDPKVIQLMRDEMTRAFNAAVESTFFSGRPNPLPEQKINLEDTIKMMRSYAEKRRENDPLLKKGIKEDWVCVLPPHFLPKIKELMVSKSPVVGIHPLLEIDRFMGRKTHVRDTVSGNIEYLSPEYYELIYGTDYRLKGEIIAKMREEKLKNNSPEGENED